MDWVDFWLLGGFCSLGSVGGLLGLFLSFLSFLPLFLGGLGVLDHGVVFDVCIFLLLHTTFHGLDIPDIVHSFVMGLYIAAR